MLSESKYPECPRGSCLSTKCYLLIAAIGITGCSSLPESPLLQVGLMDNYAQGDKTISKVGNSYNYHVNGVCKKGDLAVPCMWWGFEVAYAKHKDFTTLNCLSVKTNNPEPGNKRSLFSPTTLQYNWQVLLPPSSTKQTIAMHITNENNQTGLTTIETRCETNKITPFAFAVSINFDKKPKPKPE